MTFAEQYLEETRRVVNGLDAAAIERVVDELAGVRERGGRLFILGVGGSAANASHAVNDFRKICGFEAYAPTDNVSELTARTNDDGWATVLSEWLRAAALPRRMDCSSSRWAAGTWRRTSAESCQRHPTCEICGRIGPRRRRAGRGSHREGSGGLRDCSDRQSRACHAALGSIPGHRLAFVRVTSEAEGEPDEMGGNEVNRVAADVRRL
jgi:hypothetical protein